MGNLKRNTDIANMSIEGAPLPSARCPWADCGHWRGTPLCLMPLSRYIVINLPTGVRKNVFFSFYELVFG
jgi:hypothetical protein